MRVLPLPVWEATRWWPPARIAGMAAAWISVGVARPMASVAATSSGARPRSANPEEGDAGSSAAAARGVEAGVGRARRRARW